MKPELDDHSADGGYVSILPVEGRRLTLPKSEGEHFCLAQLDDYLKMERSNFPHQPPLKIELEAKASGSDLAGTWGFGFWNDPFSMGLLAGGVSRILPVLPNAAWYFYASPESHLSLVDQLSGSGFMARTYRSPLLPGVFSLLTMFLFPLVISKWGRRLLRRTARFIVREDGKQVDVDVCEWHAYALDLTKTEAVFLVDEEIIFQTPITPRGKLGFALWMDNQYFRFDPEGRIGFGFLPVPSDQYLQVRALKITDLKAQGQVITNH